MKVRPCLDCSADKPMRARGLCSVCYNKRRRDDTLDERPPVALNLDTNLGASPLADGLTYRQLDYWVRSGYLHPEDPAPGSGSRRRWPEAERAVARLMLRLVNAGLTVEAAHRLARAGGDLELAEGIRVLVTMGGAS